LNAWSLMLRSNNWCFLLMIQEIRLANIDSIIVHEWWRFICWNLSITHLINLTLSKTPVETFGRTHELYCWITDDCNCRTLKNKIIIQHNSRKSIQRKITLRSKEEEYLHSGAIQARRGRRWRSEREAMNTRETEREIWVVEKTRTRSHGERERK